MLRRAGSPPAAVDLLAQARADLAEAASRPTDAERYAAAHLAALRGAAAVLAAHGRPEPTERGRQRIRGAWELLPRVAPELAEWSARFAAGATRRARAVAGIPGAVTPAETDAFLRDVGMFLRRVARTLPPDTVRPARG